ncbi:hypothetical protein TI39_contig4101g00003 [Zymoseptoria brevis]|uniref:Uncharacterized protein n=1 Tax=Zymoseptoria brevis TaxID=1047168 RepID=A0A0F4GF36_9PEZI|nr:hypothetical protein TI39_contig4101g00003 [Zymoseptoria brevis]
MRLYEKQDRKDPDRIDARDPHTIDLSKSQKAQKDAEDEERRANQAAEDAEDKKRANEEAAEVEAAEEAESISSIDDSNDASQHDDDARLALLLQTSRRSYPSDKASAAKKMEENAVKAMIAAAQQGQPVVDQPCIEGPLVSLTKKLVDGSWPPVVNAHLRPYKIKGLTDPRIQYGSMLSLHIILTVDPAPHIGCGSGTEKHERNALIAVDSHSHHVCSIFFIGSRPQSVALIGVKFSLSPKTGSQDDVILPPNTMVNIAIKVPDEIDLVILLPHRQAKALHSHGNFYNPKKNLSTGKR